MNLLVHHLSVSELHRNLSGDELENWVASAKLSKNHEQWTQQEPCSSLRAPPMCTCFPKTAHRWHTDHPSWTKSGSPAIVCRHTSSSRDM
jgi:hypothetical protein